MKKLCFILCLLTAGIPFLCQCTSSENEDIAQLDTVRESVQYVQNNFISPEDYIIEKFENHENIVEEHTMLFEAISKKDSTRAGDIARRHTRLLREKIATGFSE